jgi:hypothetical protein
MERGIEPAEFKLYNFYASNGVPAELQNLGELGSALTYPDAKDFKVMMSVRVGKAILVVQGTLQNPVRLGN